MVSKKAEELAPGDDIVLWASLGGEITAVVKEVHVYDKLGVVEFTVEEIEWADLSAPIGTEVDLASE
ncbi:hypothetical protein Ssi03_12970 [Sphaerisporangium siamense]|uniref:Uncharacterized protein n=1 Tax=Sphaerisporangium siamense TaxID=795645 RepID=A0A7W7DAE5_9ACTN|nr:hypothetical protein [Sphaerisporangium siamense]MBB4702934.1 hypothetical protein [Sphaerisporangium siamense]GII83307.1 hypothetical protein Ssi03_12970 [Sphaerisporangium siamense]